MFTELNKQLAKVIYDDLDGRGDAVLRRLQIDLLLNAVQAQILFSQTQEKANEQL